VSWERRSETVVAQLPGELAKVMRVAARMVLDQRQQARERKRGDHNV
jgi:hypothetical protein